MTQSEACSYRSGVWVHAVDCEVWSCSPPPLTGQSVQSGEAPSQSGDPEDCADRVFTSADFDVWSPPERFSHPGEDWSVELQASPDDQRLDGPWVDAELASRGWSPPDSAGIRHFVGVPPPPATPLDMHTYLPPRIVPSAHGEGGARLRIVCACGWESDRFEGITLSDAAVLYSDHLQEITDETDPNGTVGS